MNSPPEVDTSRGAVRVGAEIGPGYFFAAASASAALKISA